MTTPAPYQPAFFEVIDAAAVQALARGDATASQQQRALNWIIYNAALTYDLAYRTDSRDHAFASGRQFVGSQVVKMLKLDVGATQDAIDAGNKRRAK